MPVYDYSALNQQGKTQKGIVEADGEGHARAKIRLLNLYPVTIQESKTKNVSGQGQLGIAARLLRRISSEEIYVVTRQLATLHGAGIPLDLALSSLIEQTRNAQLKMVLAQIKGRVNEGKTLAQAMGEHPRLFSTIYVNMIRAGEESGSLSVVLERLADISEKQQDLRGRLKAALYYPVFMACIGSAILFILITYVVPNITQIFKEMKQTLPVPTLLLIALSDFLQSYWWTLLVAGGLLVMTARWLITTRRGRAGWDLLKLRAPFTGGLAQKIILARFATTLASLNHSGVEFITSMRIVRTLTDNVHIEGVIDEAIERIRKGKSMTTALSASPWFPPMFVQMVAVGEQSGNLEAMLNKIATAYDRDVEAAIKGATSLLEPLMITGMGLIVGMIVISILLPIFEMNQMIH